MGAVYVQEGLAIDYTPSADVAAGDVVVQGELVGVAKRDHKAGQLAALAVAGVFDMPKATGGGTAIAAGTKVYWDGTAKRVVTSDGGGTNKFLGKTVKDATDTQDEVRVRLSQ